ncbi:MAG: calcium-translocating P-type ATPase, PMCA-type [Gemmataceae bacterium]|nr:calcium-translocating P-type ATPase, PMCA-type [Gemmataceae bacterium]
MPSAATPALPYPGLTAAEVEESRRKYGANGLTPPARDPWWKQYLSKFEDPVIRILMIAAVIQIGVGAYKGEFIEGLAIVAAIFLATTLAFLNEYKANAEFDILNRVNEDVPVKVIRDGRFLTVPRKELVVGDVVLVETGEELPVDGQVLEAVSLLIDESRLTGESMPVAKRPPEYLATHPAHKEHAYAPDRLLRGCMVADGHGTIRTTAVGDGTEIGKTARAAAEDTGEETPLNQQLERLSKLIGVVGLGIAGLTFFALIARAAAFGTLVLTGQQWVFTGIFLAAVLVALVRVWLPILYDGLEFAGVDAKPPVWLENEGLVGWLVTLAAGAIVFAVGVGIGYGTGGVPTDPGEWLPRAAAEALLNYFMIAVVIIVVAVPEGLAMSVTLSLAYSMRKMTAQNNLVRKMHACETIGAATVICSDKTGTLTRNEMRVAEARCPALTGDGFDTPAARLVAEGIAANCTAQLTVEDGVTRPLGNPTEGALLLWLNDHKLDYLAARAAFAVGNQLPFSTERKYMATAGTSADGVTRLYVKGAPEVILSRSDTVLTAAGTVPLSDAEKAAITAEMKGFQQRGMRTLGLATRPVTDVEAEIEPQVGGLTWVGFVAIADPVRAEVPGAVRACQSAGIGVKIVTGDTADTAREIGRQIGLLSSHDTPGAEMTGAEFGALPDEAAAKAVRDLRVLSRARPMDKLRLVKLLKAQDQVVAVTGDGTNDAPALNHADVGLAMGQTGTAVAKEAADIILLDDSFGSIVNAVMWGRSLYLNIQRFILFQLTINVVALGVALLGPFVGVDFPLTVMQMLWVNLIMDTFAALALATEPPDAAVLRSPPRDARAFIITPQMTRLIFGTGGAFLAVMVGFLLYFKLAGGGGEVGRKELTIFFSVFVLLQFWNLFNARTLGTNRSAFAGLAGNPYFLAIVGAIVAGQVLIVQFGGSVFRTEPLSVAEWVAVIGGTSAVLIAGELVRWWSRATTGETVVPTTAA